MDHRIREAEVSRGVMYIVYGERAAEEAEDSVASLRRWLPDMPVLRIGDAGELPVSPFDGDKFLWGRLLPYLYGASPWERTMYLDADTEFLASPETLFDLLDNWDFVLAETPERHLLSRTIEEPEMEYTRAMFGGAWWLLYHNGGMFLWRRGEAVQRFFELWHEEWVRFGSWDPQAALLRALARSEMAFLTLPYTWNCNRREETRLIYHRYGSQAAQANIRLPRGDA